MQFLKTLFTVLELPKYVRFNCNEKISKHSFLDKSSYQIQGLWSHENWTT